ncbi:MAG: hypothetical protein AB1894_17865 [Chloroflexota bacterium]
MRARRRQPGRVELVEARRGADGMVVRRTHAIIGWDSKSQPDTPSALKRTPRASFFNALQRVLRGRPGIHSWPLAGRWLAVGLAVGRRAAFPDVQFPDGRIARRLHRRAMRTCPSICAPADGSQGGSSWLKRAAGQMRWLSGRWICQNGQTRPYGYANPITLIRA